MSIYLQALAVKYKYKHTLHPTTSAKHVLGYRRHHYGMLRRGVCMMGMYNGCEFSAAVVLLLHRSV